MAKEAPEKQRNDFVDLAVGTIVSSVVFLGIFIALTAVALLG